VLLCLNMVFRAHEELRPRGEAKRPFIRLPKVQMSAQSRCVACGLPIGTKATIRCLSPPSKYEKSTESFLYDKMYDYAALKCLIVQESLITYQVL